MKCELRETAGEDQKDNFGHGTNDEKPRNFVYIPVLQVSENDD